MIQRIQTVFIFIASVLMICSAIAPLSEISSAQNILTMYASHTVDIKGVTTYSTLLITQQVIMYLTANLGFVTIMLYKKRKLQMLLTIITIIVVIALCNAVVLFSYMFIQSTDASISFNICALFPVISLILHVLAFRAIKKDEMLVRSLNRIR